jgi:hypothetical protein
MVENGAQKTFGAFLSLLACSFGGRRPTDPHWRPHDVPQHGEVREEVEGSKHNADFGSHFRERGAVRA